MKKALFFLTLTLLSTIIAYADCIKESRFYPNGSYYLISDEEEIEEDELYIMLSQYKDSTKTVGYTLGVKFYDMEYVSPGRRLIIYFDDNTKMSLPIAFVGDQDKKVLYIIMHAISFVKDDKRAWVGFYLTQEQMETISKKNVVSVLMDTDSPTLLRRQIKRNAISKFFQNFMLTVQNKMDLYIQKEKEMQEELKGCSTF